MADYRRRLAELVANTVKAQNVDVLAADFQTARADSLVRITVAMTNVLLRLVPSSGTAMTLGTPAAATLTTYELALDTGRTWNLQTNDAAGVTVYHLVIQEINR